MIPSIGFALGMSFGGWLFLILAIGFVLIMARLDHLQVTAWKRPCPKCRERVKPPPEVERKGVKGGVCPACGEWFPEDTWRQMADPGAV